MRINSNLRAIDPTGCGCTECLTGEYRPLQDATDDEIRALFLGLLRDNTETYWSIEQRGEWNDGFDVYANGHAIHLERISLPIPVERYRLTADNETIDKIRYNADYLD